jgi:choline-sulfatase
MYKLILATVFYFITSSSFGEIKNERYNILFIMTDQQHAGMMSCAGNPYLETPAMDYLAARGMRFEKAYSPNPVCAPSRTSMVTGYLPSKFGIARNEECNNAEIPQYFLNNTMGKLLSEAGYNCVYGGKTHWAKGLDMQSCGFRNLTNDSREKLAESCAQFLKSDHKKPFLLVASFINPHDICFQKIDDCAIRFNLPKLAPNARIERQMVAKAIRLANEAKVNGNYDLRCPPLKENAGLTKNMPENVFPNRFPEPDPENPKSADIYYYMDDYLVNETTEDEWRLHSWIYHRLTENVDQQIGVVLNALKESGLEKETIVIFTSDHGDMDGAHKMANKTHFYDESSRVPFIITGPGIDKGVDNDNLVSASLDLIPTFCEIAGVKVNDDLHGKSLMPLFTDAKKVKSGHFVISENFNGRMVRTRHYKYSLHAGEEPVEVLFDMEKDPGETINLSLDPRYKSVVVRHRNILIDWMKETNDPFSLEIEFNE